MGHKSELIFSGSLTVHKVEYPILDSLRFFAVFQCVNLKGKTPFVVSVDYKQLYEICSSNSGDSVLWEVAIYILVYLNGVSERRLILTSG